MRLPPSLQTLPPPQGGVLVGRVQEHFEVLFPSLDNIPPCGSTSKTYLSFLSHQTRTSLRLTWSPSPWPPQTTPGFLLQRPQTPQPFWPDGTGLLLQEPLGQPSPEGHLHLDGNFPRQCPPAGFLSSRETWPIHISVSNLPWGCMRKSIWSNSPPGGDQLTALLSFTRVSKTGL